MASIIIHIYQILFNYIELLQTIRVLRISDVTNVLQLHKAVMLLCQILRVSWRWHSKLLHTSNISRVSIGSRSDSSVDTSLTYVRRVHQQGVQHALPNW